MFPSHDRRAFKIPELENYPSIQPHYIKKDQQNWKPYTRNEETKVRYWATPGTEGFQHRIGGLEKDYTTSIISTDPANHQLMVETRQEKINAIANFIPIIDIQGDANSFIPITVFYIFPRT